jgi:hypothetical protein
MNLEERYKRAADNTYVGKVRAQQANITGNGADGPATYTTGVNFLDGQGRTRAAADDTFQTEFKRNAPGAFKYGAPGQNNSTPGSSVLETGAGGLTRWLSKALNISFGTGTHPSFGNANLYTKFKAFRGTSRWAEQTSFHRYAPITDQKFQNLDTWANTRITQGASGPSPAGLGG